MNDIFSRTNLIIGQEAIQRLKKSHVAVFGIGGVGGFCAEALARGGLGKLTLIDNDIVAYSNINRQIVALHSTINMSKVEVMSTRLKDINPNIEVIVKQSFFSEDNVGTFDFKEYDYVADAIDTVASKLLLISSAKNAKTPIISSMGAGNKLDPTAFKVSDIYKTSVCPLAKKMRIELKKRGIKDLKVVYSEELPYNDPEAVTAEKFSAQKEGRRISPGSISFVPSVVGLILAGEIIKDIIKR